MTTLNFPTVLSNKLNSSDPTDFLYCYETPKRRRAVMDPTAPPQTPRCKRKCMKLLNLGDESPLYIPLLLGPSESYNPTYRKTDDHHVVGLKYRKAEANSTELFPPLAKLPSRRTAASRKQTKSALHCEDFDLGRKNVDASNLVETGNKYVLQHHRNSASMVKRDPKCGHALSA